MNTTTHEESFKKGTRHSPAWRQDRLALAWEWYNQNSTAKVWFDDLKIEKLDNSQNEIVSETNYYPFGLTHKGYNEHVSSSNLGENWKFGNRELESELGLNGYAFGERNYNSELGRWFTVDPLAEFMRSHSPFSFGFNNPIYFNDYGGTIPWPVPEMFKNWVIKRISGKSKFGPRDGRNHNGIDVNYSGGKNTDYGAPILATHDGRVVSVNTTNNGAAGRYVTIESPDGSFSTRYLHLSALVVSAGDEVAEGQTIGLMGGSGFGYNNKADDSSSGGYYSHLHYEIRQGSTPINPMGSNGTPIDPQQWVQRPFNEANASFYGVFTIFVPRVITPAPQQESRQKATSVNTIKPDGIQPLPTPAPTPSPIIIPPAPNPLPPVIIPDPCKKPDSGCN